jgi:hypothetical protein
MANLAPLLDQKWTEGVEKTAAVKVAAEAAVKPAGIDPALLERCLRRGAAKKKVGQPGPTAADQLVLSELEAKKVREQCVRSVIAQHRRKAAPKAVKT